MVKFTLEQTTNTQMGSTCIALLFFHLGASWGWVVNATSRPLHPRERLGSHCIGGWVGPRTVLDGCGKSLLHLVSIPGPYNPQRVAIPTALHRPTRTEGTNVIDHFRVRKGGGDVKMKVKWAGVNI